ncbi:hypothetical protein ACTXT7_013273 [Hymenolepis weldensis]
MDLENLRSWKINISIQVLGDPEAILPRFSRQENVAIIGVDLERRNLDNLDNYKATSLFSLYGRLYPEESTAQDETGGISK